MLKWDYRGLELAFTVSQWSKDPSTKVGAVIMRPDKSISSVGYNGFPRKMPDNPEYYTDREEKYSRIIHGEVNALLQCREPVHGFTLYTRPFLPCDRCFVIMAQAGIVRFVAPKPTPDQLSRWGKAIDRVKLYASEMGLELVEYNSEEFKE